MYVLDNNFEIGEECYTAIREPINCECPVCKGVGRFSYNGYDVDCKQCNGSGKIRIKNQMMLTVCKVRIKRIIVSIWNNHSSVKYKVDNIDNSFLNVKNRRESTLFKTIEEAEEYCRLANTKQIAAEF